MESASDLITEHGKEGILGQSSVGKGNFFLAAIFGYVRGQEIIISSRDRDLGWGGIKRRT